jgi:hypothetical protein
MARQNLSMTPEAIRNRMRRAGKKTDRELRNLAEIHKPLDEWDIEELAHGRPRDKNGTFVGRRPTWITTTVLAEAKRRLNTKAYEMLAGHIGDAVQVIHDLMVSTAVDEFGKPIVDARTRLNAAQYIVDQVVGRPKVRVDVETNDATSKMLAGALKMTNEDGELVDAHPVIDITEDEWTDDDDR